MFQSFKDENKSSLSIVARTLHSRCLDEGWLLQVSGLYDLKEKFSGKAFSPWSVYNICKQYAFDVIES